MLNAIEGPKSKKPKLNKDPCARNTHAIYKAFSLGLSSPPQPLCACSPQPFPPLTHDRTRTLRTAEA
eukprot:3912338-Alexandrium_andersonii.AAC.1